MSKHSILILTILTVIGITGYNLRRLGETSRAPARPAGTPPVIDAAPSLISHKPQRSSIASLDVWNLKPATLPGQMPALKEMFKPFYMLNKSGRFEAIQRSDRPVEQWQFQGVVARGATLRALFYNAASRKLKNLGQGDTIDKQLIIRNVTPGSVTVEVLGEKKPLIFELHIFNANKDLYAVKRKKP